MRVVIKNQTNNTNTIWNKKLLKGMKTFLFNTEEIITKIVAKKKKTALDSLANSPKKEIPLKELKGIKKIPKNTSVAITC